MHGTLPAPSRHHSLWPLVGLAFAFLCTVIWMVFLGWLVLHVFHVL